MAFQIATAASGVLRDSHYVRNVSSGLYERTTLVEAQRTNLCLHSEDFTSAAWAKNTHITATADTHLGPDGALKADRINLADGGTGSQYMKQVFTTKSAADRYACSIWLRAGTLTSCDIAIRNEGGGTWVASTARILDGPGAVTAGAGPLSVTGLSTTQWTRVQIVVDAAVAAGLTLAFWLYIGGAAQTAAGNLVMWGGQAEQGPFASSYIPTTSATATRAADSLSLPFDAVPQAQTVYVRFVEGGTARVDNARLLQIGAASNAGPRLAVYYNGGGYRALHTDAAGTNVISGVAPRPALGDTVEIRGLLYADGSVQMGQSINGSAETMTVQSAALALSPAWSDKLLWLGGVSGANTGFNAFTHVRVERGVKTLTEMRTRAGVN